MKLLYTDLQSNSPPKQQEGLFSKYSPIISILCKSKGGHVRYYWAGDPRKKNIYTIYTIVYLLSCYHYWERGKNSREHYTCCHVTTTGNGERTAGNTIPVVIFPLLGTGKERLGALDLLSCYHYWERGQKGQENFTFCKISTPGNGERTSRNTLPVVIFPLLGTGQEQLGTIRNTRIQPANILAKILFKQQYNYNKVTCNSY